MNAFTLFSAIGFPLLMAIGGIAAWRMTRKENAAAAEPPAWRDDSLDDWRRQRDSEAEQHRIVREQETHEGAGAEEQVETVRHQRIGG